MNKKKRSKAKRAGVKVTRLVSLTGKVWNMRDHRGWGNSIGWIDWKTRRVYGHTTPHPCVGDELRADMQSGGVARFRFAKIEPCGDPPDMWFANVDDIGYVEANVRMSDGL
jgi:hypothetical protein